jgi:hypothetical protein
MTLNYEKDSNVDKLADEILVGMGKKLKANYEGDVVDGDITAIGLNLKINFYQDLTPSEKTSLDAIIASHTI